ncbi:MAG: Rod shape-determining protein MreD [Ignavibacteriae bacterium]|nr:MAG: Rod shape-determining protein MreD [Ignavibacteriota bacterium]
MNRKIKYITVAILLLILQSTFANFITLQGIAPDFLLIFIVFISLVEGRMNAMIYAFILGIVFDLTTGGVLGLSSLSKVIAAFIAGSFFNPNKTQLTLGSYRFILIVLLVSLMHNFIYYIVFVQGTEFNFWNTVLKFGIATAFYTSVVSVFLVLYFSRKYNMVKNV